MPQKTTDTISGLILLGFSAALYLYFIPNFVQSSDAGAMSPRFFPNLGAILIGLGGLVLFLLSMLERPRDEVGVEAPALNRDRAKTVVVFLIAAGMAGFILLFQWAGYIYATPLLIAVLMVLFGARNLITILLVSLTTTAALYAVFSLGLNLPLV